MKYAVALLTFAVATPALAQSNAIQSDPEQFRELICELRGICDAEEQDKAWEAAIASRELGAVGPVKGPIATVTTLSSSKASSSNTRSSASRATAPRPTRTASRRSIAPRRPVAPIVAKVTDEIKGEAPLMVTFASNSSRLTRDGQVAVATFADVLRVDSALGTTDSKFLIEGHTDSVGDGEFNLELSQKRARAVVDALVELGFSQDRFVVEGKGETEPLDGRRGRDPLNRRVIAKAID